jgi:hypothetical protein
MRRLFSAATVSICHRSHRYMQHRSMVWRYISLNARCDASLVLPLWVAVTGHIPHVTLVWQQAGVLGQCSTSDTRFFPDYSRLWATHRYVATIVKCLTQTDETDLSHTIAEPHDHAPECHARCLEARTDRYPVKGYVLCTFYQGVGCVRGPRHSPWAIVLTEHSTEGGLTRGMLDCQADSRWTTCYDCVQWLCRVALAFQEASGQQ